jgi:hypothetical protein
VLTLLFLVVGISLGAVCLIQRYRRSSSHERAQIKWLMLAVTALPIVTLAGKVSDVVNLLSVPVLIALPVSVAIAVLRHNLYDIDLIIRRTLVYGALTVILGGLYLVTVIALQTLASTVTGQTSDLAIAVATLGAAALFSPLRHQIQTVIDRYFYRRKYDAVRILADFQSSLRDEVDLNHLRHSVLAVVQETVQPEAISLWLAPTEGE